MFDDDLEVGAQDCAPLIRVISDDPSRSDRDALSRHRFLPTPVLEMYSSGYNGSVRATGGH
jgi:hypothetical protein